MKPFRTILFATDLSENSKDAFRVACSLAVENKTRLIVLHVVEPAWVPEQPVGLDQPTVQFVARTDQSHLDAVKRSLRGIYAPNHPIDVVCHVSEGDPKTEILRMAREVGSDLIVMGTHGRTGMRWLLAGSIAVAVLRGAHCPVVALRSPEVPYKGGNIRLILHPTDFSQDSEGALQVARSLARDLGARLIILHVAPIEVAIDGAAEAEPDSHDYRDAMEQIHKRLEGPDLKYPVEIRISRGFAPEVIKTTAEEVGCDLIVMGTHGRTGLSRVLLGSVAESVLPRADCPVMIVRASRKARPPASDRPVVRTATAP